ncbi:MAG: GNAT family N-acetyltransferase [bacterium]
MAAYFDGARARLKTARAADFGCTAADFDSHRLVVTSMPATAPSHYSLEAITFGTGTVLSVREAYLEWVKENAPAPHYRAMFANALLAPFVREAGSRGENMDFRAPGLGFIPADRIAARPVPPGFSDGRVDSEFRALHVQSARFDNSLGEPDDEYVAGLWRYGFALFENGEPAAVAGAYDDGDGLLEIGVDVDREYRGRGFGPVVVTNLAAIIIAEAMVPTYYCSPTNVRSQRNALASGFLPVTSGARVTKTRP